MHVPCRSLVQSFAPEPYPSQTNNTNNALDLIFLLQESIIIKDVCNTFKLPISDFVSHAMKFRQVSFLSAQLACSELEIITRQKQPKPYVWPCAKKTELDTLFLL